MKKFREFKSRVVLFVASMFAPAVSFAQSANTDARTILEGAATQVTNLAGTIINLVSIIGALVGVVMLAPNLLKYLKGDPSANDALIKVGAGLMIFVVLLQIIRVVMLRA